MGVNWNAGSVRWEPHTDYKGRSFPLNHLHPFRFKYQLPAHNNKPEQEVTIQVGFSMHCFTRKSTQGDPRSELYSDNRETRTFDYERYELSQYLKQIAQSLDQRKCQSSTRDNFLTVGPVTYQGEQVCYGVFFNLKKLPRNELLLVIQSAYKLDPAKPMPKKGKIRFKVLVGKTLRGTKPKKP